MIDYVKTILVKVSFDPHLFERELKKGIQTVSKTKEDFSHFRQWCYARFSNRYGTVLDRCFASREVA